MVALQFGVTWLIVSLVIVIPLLLLAMFCKLDPRVWATWVLAAAGIAGAVLTYLVFV